MCHDPPPANAERPVVARMEKIVPLLGFVG